MKHEKQNENTEDLKSNESNEMLEIPRADYEALQQKIKDLTALQEKMVRSAADFENAKKRLQKEKEEFSQYMLEEFLQDILPTLDNFERALMHKGDGANAVEKSVWSGLELIYKQLAQTLKSRGLKRMDVVGKPFDPHFHEAIAKVEAESKKEGLIAEELVPGYLLHEKVLRPAKVKVYGKPDSQENVETT